MKLQIVAVIVFIGAVLLGLEIQKDPGLVTVSIYGKEYSTPLTVAIAAGLVLLTAFYWVVRLLGKLWHAPRDLRRARERREHSRARRALNQGMIALAQGQWKIAGVQLQKAVAHKETALLGYLGAAQAAQSAGAIEARDQFLKLAYQADEDQIAAGITEAKLLIANQELDLAAHRLRQVLKADPKNRLALQLLKDCYLESHAWQELAELMPLLEKHKIVKAQDALLMERNAYTQILAKAAHQSDDTRALDNAWCAVPHGLRRDKQLMSVYIRHLMEHGEGSRPESILRSKLNAEWDDDLAYLYGVVENANAAQQLAHAEKWLRRQPDNATLLLTLGRLALRNHLWGKARSYLEQSASLDPRPETFMLLGRLLEQTGENLIAGEVFRKGLGISVNKELLRLERSPLGSDGTPVALAAIAAPPAQMTLVSSATGT